MANERLQLEIVAKTVGDESVQKLTDSLNRVISTAESAGERMAAAGARAQVLRQAADQTGEAFGHSVPQIAAASGAIREFEGSLPIRAVERFLTTTLQLGPVLSTAFPIVGGIAFAEMLGKVAMEFDPAIQAAKAFAEESKKLESTLEQLGKKIEDNLGRKVGAVLGPEALQRFRAFMAAGDMAELDRKISDKQQSITALGSKISPFEFAESLPVFGGIIQPLSSRFRGGLQYQKMQQEGELFALQQERRAAQTGMDADNAQAEKDKQDKLNESRKKGAEELKKISEIVLRSHQEMERAIERTAKTESDYQARRLSDAVRVSDEIIRAEMKEDEQRKKNAEYWIKYFDELTALADRYEDERVKRAQDARKQLDEAEIGAMRAGAQHQGRILELSSRDDAGALREGLALRLQAAQAEYDLKEREMKAGNALYDLDLERAKLNREQQDAQYAFEEKVLELRNKQMASFRESVQRGFDDILSGRGGVNILRAFTSGIERQIVGNVADMIYPQVQKMTSGMHLSGTMGKLLAGTPFGADPLKAATDANTAATAANTAAIQQMLSLSPSGGGGGVVRGLPSIFGAGASTSNPFVFSATDGSLGTDPLGNSIPDIGATPLSVLGKNGGGMSIAKGVGMAGAAATGGIAAFQDFRRGGAGGALQGTGALAGAAGAMMMMAGMTGPAAPIVAGIGMALSLIGGMFNSKAKRESEISKELERGQYQAPMALNVSQDTAGNYTDFDMRGNLRTSNFRAVPMVSQPYLWWKGSNSYQVPGRETSPYQTGQTIVNHGTIVTGPVQAMDAGSFRDFAQRNAHTFGDATATALQSGGSNRLRAAIAGN